MKLLKLVRQLIASACIVNSFIATAGNQPTNTELQLLQGKWEGVMVGDQAQQKITITVIGNSLHFHRDANFWFDTTITVPGGKDPKQLHATIKDCPPQQKDSLGKIVKAFFKVDQMMLTLATIGDDTEETAQGFEAAGTRYELRRVQKKSSEASPTK